MTTWLPKPDSDPDHDERTRHELDDDLARQDREAERRERAEEKTDVDPWLPRAHRLARREGRDRRGDEGERQR